MKMICWYCGKPIGGNTKSVHHFFNYNDIKFRLIRIFGEPRNDEEHNEMHRMIDVIQKNMVQLPVHKKCHAEIEKKVI